MADRIRVLLVEDNPADIEMIGEILDGGRFDVALSVATDGLEALRLLDEDIEQPKLILLDLNLPRMDGRQFLAELRSRQGLRTIPVVILTSSDAHSDVERSYAAGANCFVTKPMDFLEFQKTVQAVEDFWFEVAKLPPPATQAPGTAGGPTRPPV